MLTGSHAHAASLLGILLVIGCGGGGRSGIDEDLQGFGDVASAFISPCAIESADGGELLPSAFGFVKARERSCGGDLQGLVPRFDSCGEYSIDDPSGVCPSVGADTISDVFVFQFGAIASLDDLTGESTSFLQLSPCSPEETATVDSEYVPADIVVLADDGATAEVAIGGDLISGTIDVRICR